MIRLLSSWIITLTILMASTSFAGETITIDLSRDQGPAIGRATGFLHTLAVDAPADEFIIPLKPRLFRAAAGTPAKGRGALATWERIKGMKAQLQIVISDSYGYAHDGPWPGDGGDWSGWENVVAGLVHEASRRGMVVQWDIWNEPDIDIFWNASPEDKTIAREQFFETWRRGYQTIRLIDPQAVIVGPSNSEFKGNLFPVADFLIYARDHDVLPDLVAWHEWRPEAVVPHVREIREFMQQNNIPERPVSINEYVHRWHQTQPGILTAYIAALEEAEVESAAHACWPDEKEPYENCYAPSLNGILSPVNYQPRPAWWVYRRYADITGQLVRVPASQTVRGLGGVDGNAAQFLFGRVGEATGEVEIQFRRLNALMPRAGNSNRIHLTMERIPDRGWEALEQPVITVDKTVPAASLLKVMLSEFAPNDAYYVKFTVSSTSLIP